MPERIDTLITHAHLFTLQGDGVGTALGAVRLNVLEALKAGTTTHFDYAQIGVRARLTPRINVLPPGGMASWKVGDLYPLDPDADQTAIDATVAFARDWHGAAGGRIIIMFAPPGPRHSTPRPTPPGRTNR